ncbi:MAG: c-type cytochrome [Acidobacteria bacterium]|nr:c-type cytochrome [Acidobacteriota bacterium]
MRLCIIFLGIGLAAQHDASKEGKPKNPAFGNPEAIAAGKKLYANSCAACHGPTGQGGRGPNLRHRGAWHPLEDDGLFRIIEKGVPSSDMPGSNLPESQIWQTAAFVRSLTAPAIESTTIPGDPAAGESLFTGKAGCVNCHRVSGRGGMLGPDLSNIGAMKALEDIRESILDPDADGFHRYKAVTVSMKNGTTIKGVARNRNNYSMQVQDAKGELHLLNMRDVKEVTVSEHSPMPRNYAQRLSKEELDNVIAYLARQSVRPRDAAKK